jgi:lipoprotein-releasing system permease protein
VRSYGVPIIGVIPEQEADATRLTETVVQGTFLTSRDSIVLGASVAEDLAARIGDPMHVKVIDKSGTAQTKKVTVVGISKTAGGLGFDTSAIVNIETLRDITGRDESSELIVRLYDQKDAAKVSQIFSTRYAGERFEVETAQESGSDIIEGIRSGIAFINLVGYFGLLSASFAIVTIMMLMVSSKTRDIGIIKAIGGKSTDIVAVFILQGLIIGTVAAAGGFILGSAAGLYLQSVEFSFGPGLVLEVVYDPEFTATVSLSAVALGVAAAIYPAFRASKLEPIKAIGHG